LRVSVAFVSFGLGESALGGLAGWGVVLFESDFGWSAAGAGLVKSGLGSSASVVDLFGSDLGWSASGDDFAGSVLGCSAAGSGASLPGASFFG
jgi:hypothetical protein